MAESNMITIAYFYLLHPSEYTSSKSDITPFRLEDTAFSCGRSAFVATFTASDLHAKKICHSDVHNPEERRQGGGGGILQKASGDPLL